MSDASKIYGSQPLPAWVEWVAVDNDGCVWGFSSVPEYYDGCWNSLGSAIPLGAMLPREVQDATQYPDDGNGQLWEIDNDIGAEDVPEDDPVPTALMCVIWAAFGFAVVVLTSAGAKVWTWLCGPQA